MTNVTVSTGGTDGRYVEIRLNGSPVPDGSIAYDTETNELIVDTKDCRTPVDEDGAYGIIAKLPEGEHPLSDR